LDLAEQLPDNWQLAEQVSGNWQLVEKVPSNFEQIADSQQKNYQNMVVGL